VKHSIIIVFALCWEAQRAAADDDKTVEAASHRVAWRWEVSAQGGMPLAPIGPEFFIDGKKLGSGEKGLTALISSLREYRHQKIQISTWPEKNPKGPTFVGLPPLLSDDWGRLIEAAQREQVTIVIDHKRPETNEAAVHAEPNQAEQGGTGQPATRSQSKSEGSDKPQPEAEGRSR
jgi:hypothetical protein